MEYENLVESYLLNSEVMKRFYENYPGINGAKDIKCTKAAENDSKIFYNISTPDGGFLLDSGFIVVDKKTGEVYNPFFEKGKNNQSFYEISLEFSKTVLNEEDQDKTLKYFNYGK